MNSGGRRKLEVARYGQNYKDRVVARLLPPESSAVDEVSRQVGISVAMLERWRAEALAGHCQVSQGWHWDDGRARLTA